MSGLTIERGVCRRCGCTEERACAPVGCYWADVTGTLCNLCAFVDEMDSRLVPSFSEVLAASMGLGDMEIVGSASGGHQLIL